MASGVVKRCRSEIVLRIYVGTTVEQRFDCSYMAFACRPVKRRCSIFVLYVRFFIGTEQGFSEDHVAIKCGLVKRGYPISYRMG